MPDDTLNHPRDLRRELDRYKTALDEAHAREAAMAEVLQVINSSRGDLTPVFEAMLEKAMRLCGGSFGVFAIFESEHYRVAASRGLPAGLAEFVRDPVSIQIGSMPDRLRHGEETIQVPDISTLEGEPRTPGLVAMIELGNARTAVWVVLRKDGVAQGFFGVYRQEVQPFSDKQIALLQNFATQAVLAMENARLLTETREALEQQTATSEVLGVINSSPGDLAPVFDAMLEKAMRLCDASFGSFVSFDGELFHNLTHRGVPAELAEQLQAPLRPTPGGAFARLVRGEVIVHITDIKDDEAYRSGLRGRVAMVDVGGARTAIWVALCKDTKLLGAFVIYRQEVRPFTDKQIALLQNFSAQAVIAMENARLLRELRERTDEVAKWNRDLEARVAAQLAELEQTGKLRRFLAPQLADLIVARGDDKILESHRREIVVVFCDLRGFTGFAERAEPEEVMALLRDYHAAMGPIVAHFEGTIDHYSGDGIMVFFNDPMPTPDPAQRAIEMAMAMREAAQGLLGTWRGHGHDLGFGVGISQGYATLGQIGFAERMDYTAIGTVTNLAARLCDEAKDGQILVSRRVATVVQDVVGLEEIGDLSLKGLSQAVGVFNVV
jgi:class 3 adenylate cyclase